MPQDFVASFSAVKGTDLLHHGVKGQKWGVRRARGPGGLVDKSSSGSGRSAAKTDHVGKAKGSTQTLSKPAHSGTETSIDRYTRLKSEVKKNGAHKLNDDDLKFFNARTDAVKRANQTFNKKGSFLQKTVQLAIAAAATKLIKDVTQAAVSQHVTPSLFNSLKLASPS